MNLSGKVAIVTGAARGIGYAIAERFVLDGARVMLVDSDAAALRAATETLGEKGDVAGNGADVGEKLDVHNMIAATLDEFDAIDVLVNNAAMLHPSDFLSLSEDAFDAVMRVNLKGVFLASQAVARQMVTRVAAGGPAGSIVNISSVFDTLAAREYAAYSISKGALKQLTTVAAQSLAPHGIRVNAVGPGTVATSMLDDVVGNGGTFTDEQVLARTPFGRFGQPEEIAAIAAFLASDDASYVTGQTIYADGGRMGLHLTVPVRDDDED